MFLNPNGIEDWLIENLVIEETADFIFDHSMLLLRVIGSEITFLQENAQNFYERILTKALAEMFDELRCDYIVMLEA